MMKAGERTVTTCRKEDGSLTVYDSKFVSVRKKHKLLNLPIIRGVVNFIEMMKLSIQTLGDSAEALGIEEEDGKTEKWVKKHLGISLTDLVMVVSVILGLGLAVGLFIALPALLADLVDYAVVNWFGGTPLSPSVIAVVEGCAKTVIFIAYLALVSLMKDIRRTFMYHGAEHKSIACFEAGEELTPENAMKHRRFHPRCGTSFMFLMILLGIAAGMFVRNVFPGIEQIESKLLSKLAYVGIRLAILPLIMGIGYEILMLAGKHDNLITRMISAPGMWAQRITTKEPTEDMLEVAITSIKCALRDDFPEFMEFWQAKPWQTKADSSEDKPAEDKPEEQTPAEEAEQTPAEDRPIEVIEDKPAEEAEQTPAEDKPIEVIEDKLAEEAEAKPEEQTPAEEAEQTPAEDKPIEVIEDKPAEEAEAKPVEQTPAEAEPLLTPPDSFGGEA